MPDSRIRSRSDGGSSRRSFLKGLGAALVAAPAVVAAASKATEPEPVNLLQTDDEVIIEQEQVIAKLFAEVEHLRSGANWRADWTVRPTTVGTSTNYAVVPYGFSGAWWHEDYTLTTAEAASLLSVRSKPTREPRDLPEASEATRAKWGLA